MVAPFNCSFLTIVCHPHELLMQSWCNMLPPLGMCLIVGLIAAAQHDNPLVDLSEQRECFIVNRQCAP